MTSGGTGDVPGGCGVGSGVSCLHQTDGGAPGPMHLQRLRGFLAVPLWQGRQPSVWFWRIIAGCLCIVAFTFSCPGYASTGFFSCLTWASGSFIGYCCSSIAPCKNPPWALLRIFNAQHMSDCLSCTRVSCLAIVADMLKTFKKLAAPSSYEIRQLPPPYEFPEPPWRWFKPVWSTSVETYPKICARNSKSWHHQDVWLHWLCWQMPCLTMPVSHQGQKWICHWALYVY